MLASRMVLKELGEQKNKNMAQLYPIFTDISGRRVLVVGGGKIAEEKVTNLISCQADIRLVSPKLTEPLELWASKEKISLFRRKVESADIDDAWLVIVACGVQSVNQWIYQRCQEKHIFCNVVDVTELCMFQVPAICRSGPLQLAVSTAGKSPALAKRIRQKLEKEYDQAYAILLETLGELRPILKEKYPDDLDRRSQIFERLANSNALELIRENRQKEFDLLVQECKNS
jgi:siroheme synthase-like protein